MPSWINDDLLNESAKILEENDVQYGDEVSYHQMCRWNSGYFYRHPALADVRWYWRVEPKVHFFCDIDYDVFRWMEDHNKTYGFTITLYDSAESLPRLWPETLKFMAAHQDYVHPNNALRWLTDSQRRPDTNAKAHGYSTCHFWSNFEIADMTFWRSRVYQDYFDHLDRAGGFFYERWGDAPVHSIALGLFEDASKIHWSVLVSLLFFSVLPVQTEHRRQSFSTPSNVESKSSFNFRSVFLLFLSFLPPGTTALFPLCLAVFSPSSRETCHQNHSSTMLTSKLTQPTKTMLTPNPNKIQVPRHWLPAHPLLQLSQLAQVLRLRPGPVHRRRKMASARGLPTKLVQIRRHGMTETNVAVTQ